MAVIPRPGFPPEIIEKSLKYLNPLTFRGRQGLAKCLLLSKTYRSIALPLFYETFAYTGNASHRSSNDGIFKALLTFLQNHPLQAALIKHLVLSGYVVYREISSGNKVFSLTPLCILRDIIQSTPSLQSLRLCSLRIQNLCEHSHHAPYHNPPPYYRHSDRLDPRHIRRLVLQNVTLSTTGPYLMQLSHLQHLVAPDAITLSAVRRTSMEAWTSLWKHTASTLHLNLDSAISLHANVGVVT